MKNKFIMLFGMLLTYAFITSVMAQHRVNTRSDDRTVITTVKNNAPNAWEKSNKDVLFYEDFSNGGFNDWTIMGEGLLNWSLIQNNEAGGEIPEANMHYTPEFIGISRFVSKTINTSGYSNLGLSFLHLIDSYQGDFWVKIETTSDGGATWNMVWEKYTSEQGDYFALEIMDVNTPDVGSENFQLSFTFDGNSYNINDWVIDNITFSDPIIYDVMPTAILGLDEALNSNNEVIISSTIKNGGAETVTFDVILKIKDGTNVVYESTKSISDLVFGDEVTVDFDAWLTIEGYDYTAIVTTMLSGDENPANDEILKPFDVFPENYYCVPSAVCEYGDGIKDFAWAGIENYDNGCSPGGFGQFNDLEATVEIGHTYTATFAGPYTYQVVSMWIDFNQDFEFSENERVVTDFMLELPDVFYYKDITIPGNALPGITTLRIGANWYYPSSSDPCGFFDHGEWEDYSVNITGTAIDYNAGVVSIDLDPIMPSGDIAPFATVRNYSIETVSFPVTMTVEGTSYSSTINVTDLEVNGEIQVEFDTWNAPTGEYTVNVCTELSSDQYPDNDCMSLDIVARQYDVGVVSINIPVAILPGNIIPEATIKNYAFQTVSFPVTMTIAESGYTSTIDVTSLAAGQEVTVIFDAWTDNLGTYNIEVQTELAQDEYVDNDIMDSYTTIIENAPPKMVVGEEGTGTWCGWCVRGAVYMDFMAEEYPETWIGIASHNSDPMTVPEYDVAISTLIGFAYPGGIVNRDIVTDPSGFEGAYLQKIDKIAPAEIFIENIFHNTTTNELSFTVTADFVAQVSNYRFNAVLIENGVTGTGPGWDQSNYYAGGGNGPMGGYENLPDPVPAEDMIYEHVARAILGDFEGVEGSLPETILAGETHSYDFVITLSEDWDTDNLEIVGMLIDYETGEIENSAVDHIIVGVHELDATTKIIVYPNPASDMVNIKANSEITSLEVYNNIGQIVYNKAAGTKIINFNTNQLKSGMHLFRIHTSEGIFDERVVIK